MPWNGSRKRQNCAASDAVEPFVQPPGERYPLFRIVALFFSLYTGLNFSYLSCKHSFDYRIGGYDFSPLEVERTKSGDDDSLSVLASALSHHSDVLVSASETPLERDL